MDCALAKPTELTHSSTAMVSAPGSDMRPIGSLLPIDRRRRSEFAPTAGACSAQSQTSTERKRQPQGVQRVAGAR